MSCSSLSISGLFRFLLLWLAVTVPLHALFCLKRLAKFSICWCGCIGNIPNLNEESMTPNQREKVMVHHGIISGAVIITLASLRSWRDFRARWFGCKAVKASGSAVDLVAKPWKRVAQPWEDWWRVELRLRRSRIHSRALPVREIGGSAAARPLTHPASYAG